MQSVIPLSEKIFWLGVNDHETRLFEAIWPLPKGVSYNSYLIRDEKTALIDTVKEFFMPEFLEKVKSALKQGEVIDYLIINHMEPDHSGCVKAVLDLFPAMQIVGNEKTAGMLKGFFGIERNVKIIKDKESLDLGSHKLNFLLAPMVHWPETMLTYEEREKILFSGDVFGGFGALSDGIFDDQVDLNFFEGEILRYFSNIIGKFSSMAQRAIQRLEGMEIKIVASAHGPVFRKDPRHIISLYDKWSRQLTEEGVVVVYASMYGNTEKMARAVAESLVEEKVKEVKVYNISRTHSSFIINDIWRYKGVILGACTYNNQLFPLMDNLLRILGNDTIANHCLGLFSSYSWSGGANEALKQFAQKSRWQIIEPSIDARCSPSERDLENCRLLGKNMARALI